jgi:hypothetical protein
VQPVRPAQGPKFLGAPNFDSPLRYTTSSGRKNYREPRKVRLVLGLTLRIDWNPGSHKDHQSSSERGLCPRQRCADSVFDRLDD